MEIKNLKSLILDFSYTEISEINFPKMDNLQ